MLIPTKEFKQAAVHADHTLSKIDRVLDDVAAIVVDVKAITAVLRQVVTKLGVLAVLVLALATPAVAQTPAHPKDPVFRVAVVGMLAGHGADLFSTGKCLGAGTCVEVNPFLRPLQGGSWGLGAAKMAGVALQLWLVERLHGWNKWAGRVTAAVIGGAMLALGIRNGRVAGTRAGPA